MDFEFVIILAVPLRLHTLLSAIWGIIFFSIILCATGTTTDDGSCSYSVHILDQCDRPSYRSCMHPGVDMHILWQGVWAATILVHCCPRRWPPVWWRLLGLMVGGCVGG